MPSLHWVFVQELAAPHMIGSIQHMGVLMRMCNAVVTLMFP